MGESKCGACNFDIPIDHVAMHRLENDGEITSYHMSCEGVSTTIKPCIDCGNHRLLCDECKES